MSVREAAESIGVSASTLCNHLKAAKRRLEQILAPHALRAGLIVAFSASARAS
jgi:hypothetical protein